MDSGTDFNCRNPLSYIARKHIKINKERKFFIMAYMSQEGYDKMVA